jgi:hypothetical protein
MLEQKLVAVDAATAEAVRVNRELASVIKKLRKSSETGDLQQLRRCLTDFNRLIGRLQLMSTEITSILDFEEEAYLGSESFLNELIEAAHTAGVRAFLGENTLYSYPLAVRVHPQKRAILVGKHRDPRLRPSFVGQQLKKYQVEAGRIAELSFLEVLYTAYNLLVTDRVLGRSQLGKVIPLADVYNVLTLLPQVSREYTRHDFSVDIYRLDKSRIQKTKDGTCMTLPASTGTRATSGTLSVVSETGQKIRYYGVAFNESKPPVEDANETLA